MKSSRRFPAAVVVSLLMLAASALAIRFLVAPTYATGIAPVGVAAGDFNGDGKNDLVVANSGSNTVGILLGNGNGTFGAQKSFVAGTNPVAVAVGDFNGDGHLDVAVANAGSSGTGSSVMVLLGNGDGTLQTAKKFTAGNGPSAIAVGDFNGDGKLDLAVANAADNTVSVLLGNGDGTFGTAKTTPAGGGGPGFLAIGDFNHDGKLDVVVSTSGNNLFFLAGNGDGTFQTAASIGGCDGAVAAGDFNKDGNLDLVCGPTIFGEGQASVLLGNGNGTFQFPIQIAIPGRGDSVVVGDFNGDGHLDFAMGDSNTNNLTVVLGNGNGTFQSPVRYIAGEIPMGLVAADFNGDGKLDLAATNNAANVVGIFLNSGNAVFQAETDFFTNVNVAGPVALGDFNRDGNLDVAIGGFGNGNIGVSILLGNGKGGFQATTTLPPPNGGLGALAVGDFNGDGKLDVVVINGQHGPPFTLFVYLGNGDGTFQAPINTSLSVAANSVAVGDFNRDGKLDVALISGASTLNDKVSVLLGNGDGTFKTPADFTLPGDGNAIAVGDFNHDGKLDIAAANGNPNPNAVTVLLGKGDGTFQSAGNFSMGNNGGTPSGIVLGDFNRDGKLDVAVSTQGGQVSVLLGNGDGTLQTAVVSPLTASATGLAVGDINGDGKLDLVTSNSNGGHNIGDETVNLLLGKGDGTFFSPVTFAVGENPSGVAVADFNRDGAADVVVSNFDSGFSDVSVLLNTGGVRVTLISSLNPSTFGQAVTFTATVTPAMTIFNQPPPTGTVTFKDGTVVLGTAALSTTGQATFTTSTLSGGTHTITAVYNGDKNYVRQSSVVLTQTVNRAATSTALTSSPNPSTFGQAVTFTATVSSSAAGTPTGTVTFKDSTATLGTGTLNSAKQATFTTSALSVGKHSITAVYAGDMNFAGSTSPVLTQTVNP